ncbi:MAG: diaminopimelate decarboxylase [Vulcanimicrobiaceae bacterium]
MISSTQADGRELALGGVGAATLAATYGTPLLAIDTDVFDANVARFAAVGAELGIEVAYAGKALLLVALAKRLASTPLGLDICSLGELVTAERAGFPRDRLTFHGCGKRDDELQAAADGRVARVVVDGREELTRLAAVAHPDRPIAIVLRVNTGIAVHTHDYVRTGGENSKFGFALRDVDEAVAFALAQPGLRIIGLHSHLGSQIFDAAPFAENVRVLVEVGARLRARGAPCTELIAGGGFGVPAHRGDEPLDLATTLGAMAQAVAAESARRRIAAPRLGIEPGRAIVAEAGTSLYRVVAVKTQGARRFAIVDGGLADNPRPALYDAYHEPQLAARPEPGQPAAAVETTVCGRSCENDELVVARLPGDLRAGDLLALRTTGAYTYSMASNYNRFARPAVVFAGGGRHHLVARRETVEDVLRNDVDATT